MVTKKLNVEVSVVKIGNGHVAATQLGGITVRGPRASDEAGAVQNLLWTLSGQGRGGDANDEALMGIELALAGTSFEREIGMQTTNERLLNEAGGDGGF